MGVIRYHARGVQQLLIGYPLKTTSCGNPGRVLDCSDAACMAWISLSLRNAVTLSLNPAFQRPCVIHYPR